MKYNDHQQDIDIAFDSDDSVIKVSAKETKRCIMDSEGESENGDSNNKNSDEDYFIDNDIPKEKPPRVL